MKKKIMPIVLMMIVVAMFLGACSNVSNLSDVQIVEKINEYEIEDADCNPSIDCGYYIIVEKNDEQIQLNVPKKMYKALKEGNVVNVNYYDNFIVKDIEFPNMK